ncbi:protein ZNF365 isoform X2 [Protopterus annectens]|uniref:protein ZNF365 isoform X2 n=1 Tax=Protopterus annectens TaxID=7888 RepID=UPI001CFA897F|nr:protein ZNF365 isoform X2 [Protopterus annectens]
MQERTCEQWKHLWCEEFENAKVNLPFRCPRCGEHMRFRSLSSLRAHLEYSHTYEDVGCGSKRKPLICTMLDSSRTEQPLLQKEPVATYFAEEPKHSSAGAYDLLYKRRTSENVEGWIHKPFSHTEHQSKNFQTGENDDLQLPKLKSSFQSDFSNKFNGISKGVDRSIKATIDQLTKELAQKSAELIDVKMAYMQLIQKKQDVHVRERNLSRQIDIAVEMIAVLRQKITNSEQELNSKEIEIININNLLGLAAEKECRGKARLQHFIESLLQRINVAEKQLEQHYRTSKLGNYTKNKHTGKCTSEMPAAKVLTCEQLAARSAKHCKAQSCQHAGSFPMGKKASKTRHI